MANFTVIFWPGLTTLKRSSKTNGFCGLPSTFLSILNPLMASSLIKINKYNNNHNKICKIITAFILPSDGSERLRFICQLMCVIVKPAKSPHFIASVSHMSLSRMNQDNTETSYETWFTDYHVAKKLHLNKKS